MRFFAAPSWQAPCLTLLCACSGGVPEAPVPSPTELVVFNGLAATVRYSIDSEEGALSPESLARRTLPAGAHTFTATLPSGDVIDQQVWEGAPSGGTLIWNIAGIGAFERVWPRHVDAIDAEIWVPEPVTHLDAPLLVRSELEGPPVDPNAHIVVRIDNGPRMFHLPGYPRGPGLRVATTHARFDPLDSPWLGSWLNMLSEADRAAVVDARGQRQTGRLMRALLVGHEPPAACAQLDIPAAIERGAGDAYLAVRCTDTAAVGAAAHARWPDDPLLTYRHALWVAASGDWAAACALGLSTPAAIGWFEAPLARDYLSICRMARGADAEATFHAMLGPEHPTSRLLHQRAAPNPDDPDDPDLVNRAMWAMQQRTWAQGLAAMDDHMTSDVKSGLSHALAWSAWIEAGDRTPLEALTATYITVPNWHAMDGHETEQLASLIAVDGDVDAFLAMTADPDGRLARFRPVLEAGKAGNLRPYHRLLPTLGLHDQMALGLAAAVVAGPAATEDMRRRAMFGGSQLHQPMIGLEPSRSGR